MTHRYRNRSPSPFPTRRRNHNRRPRLGRIQSTWPTKLPYKSRGALLSRGEAAFYGPLMHALRSEFLVMCKVRLADVVTCPVRSNLRGPFAAISQKHLDFVLCEPRTTRIILAIELDDRSHDAPRRRRRDCFVNETLLAANIPLLRVQAQAWYSLSALRESIRLALGDRSSQIHPSPNQD